MVKKVGAARRYDIDPVLVGTEPELPVLETTSEDGYAVLVLYPLDCDRKPAPCEPQRLAVYAGSPQCAYHCDA